MRLILIAILAVLLATGGNVVANDPISPLAFDAASIIDIHTDADAARLRSQLIDLLWCGQLPTAQPTIEEGRIIVQMDFGLQSIGRLHRSPQPNNRLIVYHHGHGQRVGTNPTVISAFVAAGYDVAEFSMPGTGAETGVWVDDPDFGYIYVHEHGSFSLLQSPCGHPLKYFLEPVIVFLNYAQAHYDDIAMAGLSGGGWTTTLVAALDTRISRSFPVAGSLPHYLRYGSSLGDWEQIVPEVYRIADYLELYIMAAGPGRVQVQILNLHDSCCFRGEQATGYAGVVAERAAGRWELWIDDSHKQHIISPAAVGRILAALDEPLPGFAVWLPWVKGE